LGGGNETGVFVTAVQAGCPASLQGLQPGDKILKVSNFTIFNFVWENKAYKIYIGTKFIIFFANSKDCKHRHFRRDKKFMNIHIKMYIRIQNYCFR